MPLNPTRVSRGVVKVLVSAAAVLVSGGATLVSAGVFLQKAKTLSEGAGASSLAGALQIRDRLQDKKVALILSGGNITPEQLKQILIQHAS